MFDGGDDDVMLVMMMMMKNPWKGCVAIHMKIPIMKIKSADTNTVKHSVVHVGNFVLVVECNSMRILCVSNQWCYILCSFTVPMNVIVHLVFSPQLILSCTNTSFCCGNLFC